MSLPARKPTLWTLRKVFTRISLSMPRRLTRIDNSRLLWIFCFRDHYANSLSSLIRNISARISLLGVRMLIWSIHYAEAIMLIISRDLPEWVCVERSSPWRHGTHFSHAVVSGRFSRSWLFKTLLRMRNFLKRGLSVLGTMCLTLFNHYILSIEIIRVFAYTFCCR